MRDNDLREPELLDVQKYPTITLKSKRAESAGQQTKITGVSDDSWSGKEVCRVSMVLLLR